MDILYLMIKLFIWAVALALSIIPGIIAGYFGELLLGKIGYWLGFAFGVIIFLVNMGPLLSFRDDKPIQKPGYKRPYRRFPLLPFLAGLWLGSEFLDNDD